MKASPTPSITLARCESGARSPEAPTEPCAGTTGSTPLTSIASSVAVPEASTTTSAAIIALRAWPSSTCE
ncbi:hypothetical protein G6F56_014245 [Rhizopus delemar]|nr:hypothetical protein G6F56_014245 [Rhizopus delemar]